MAQTTLSKVLGALGESANISCHFGADVEGSRANPVMVLLNSMLGYKLKCLA